MLTSIESGAVVLEEVLLNFFTILFGGRDGWFLGAWRWWGAFGAVAFFWVGVVSD